MKYLVKMREGFFVFILMITCFGVSAQTIELEQDVNADTVVSNYGKNRKHYVSSFFGYGITTGQLEMDSIQLKEGKSSRFNFGVCYKYKVANPYSILASLSFNSARFEFETADNIKFNRLKTNDVALEISNRINFGKRGNAIGYYLEFGVSGAYVIGTKQLTKKIIDDVSVNHKTRLTELTGLSYIERPNYSAHVRFGMNKYVLTADYRMSDITNDNINFDLPPLTIGMRFDFGG